MAQEQLSGNGEKFETEMMQIGRKAEQAIAVLLASVEKEGKPLNTEIYKRCQVEGIQHAIRVIRGTDIARDDMEIEILRENMDRHGYVGIDGGKERELSHETKAEIEKEMSHVKSTATAKEQKKEEMREKDGAEVAAMCENAQSRANFAKWVQGTLWPEDGREPDPTEYQRAINAMQWVGTIGVSVADKQVQGVPDEITFYFTFHDYPSEQYLISNLNYRNKESMPEHMLRQQDQQNAQEAFMAGGEKVAGYVGPSGAIKNTGEQNQEQATDANGTQPDEGNKQWPPRIKDTLGKLGMDVAGMEKGQWNRNEMFTNSNFDVARNVLNKERDIRNTKVMDQKTMPQARARDLRSEAEPEREMTMYGRPA
ncbi:MAG: hypothetical protein FWE38_02445 [Firmicutes bacterium]|nr:hypothetical protein [Bacillota bacterium]